MVWAEIHYFYECHGKGCVAEGYERSSSLDICLDYDPEVEINPLALSTTLELHYTAPANYKWDSWGAGRKGSKLSQKFNSICWRTCAMQEN